MLDGFIETSTTFLMIVIPNDFNLGILQINELHESHKSKCFQRCLNQHDLKTIDFTQNIIHCLITCWINVPRNDFKVGTTKLVGWIIINLHILHSNLQVIYHV